jgi:hypothetical protein
LVKAALGALGAAAALFVCCVLPILLVGGGAAAVTAGIAREARVMVPLGLVLLGAGVVHILVRRARARRRASSGRWFTPLER